MRVLARGGGEEFVTHHSAHPLVRLRMHGPVDAGEQADRRVRVRGLHDDDAEDDDVVSGPRTVHPAKKSSGVGFGCAGGVQATARLSAEDADARGAFSRLIQAVEDGLCLCSYADTCGQPRKDTVNSGRGEQSGLLGIGCEETPPRRARRGERQLVRNLCE